VAWGPPVIANLRRLVGYRALIQSLVARDLKARYRGSALGFFWSFVNPLLLLSIYTFVFTQVLPGLRGEHQPYALFLFCGILPWTWFSSALLESSTVLISGGNLIRKVLFPAEVLPIVTVLATLVHFGLGLLIVAGAIAYVPEVEVAWTDLLWLPVIVLVQLVLTLALALLLSALTVHFRDLRDLLANALTLWFWASPIIYPLEQVDARWHVWLNLNPFTHLAVAYQQVLFVEGPYPYGRNLVLLGAGSLALLAVGYIVFDRLRDTLAEAV
jgi:ABC-type polysaccharide/polyol phosphate export permease